MDYLTAKVPPPQANLPKPRFSRYLSPQLQCGVVTVYHRQCSFLLGEAERQVGQARIETAESKNLIMTILHYLHAAHSDFLIWERIDKREIFHMQYAQLLYQQIGLIDFNQGIECMCWIKTQV